MLLNTIKKNKVLAHEFLFPTHNLQLQKGFTLLELLVIFSIVAILSGIGVASFTSYSRSQQLTQSANNIKLIFNEARFNSLSAVKSHKNESGSTISCGVETLLGYSVNKVSNNQLELDLLCSNLGQQEVRTLKVPNGYSFGNATTCTQIIFGTLSSTSTGLPCTLVVTGFSKSKSITIDVNGNALVQ